MAAPKTKTEAERVERRARVAQLYLEGYSMDQVGKMLGISRDTVFRDLRWCREQWRTKAVDATEKHIQNELAKINMLEAEAWRAWIRSIGKKTKTTEEIDKNGKANKIIETTEFCAGDPRFLDHIFKCIERSCKLLGLDAPTRSIVEDRADDLAKLVEEARARLLKAKKQKETPK